MWRTESEELSALSLTDCRVLGSGLRVAPLTMGPESPPRPTPETLSLPIDAVCQTEGTEPCTLASVRYPDTATRPVSRQSGQNKVIFGSCEWKATISYTKY
ncbi:unnamed protein product [Pleuronectes platessa]|uniref:Uncharacterized protein n=1 Tax=Pleuronectes platessa TaxID=8262 RepID=A0A9N7UDX9_PLEPL|nr:unnamed protein product [Pleuronectes platessa]